MKKTKGLIFAAALLLLVTATSNAQQSTVKGFAFEAWVRSIQEQQGSQYCHLYIDVYDSVAGNPPGCVAHYQAFGQREGRVWPAPIILDRAFDERAVNGFNAMEWHEGGVITDVSAHGILKGRVGQVLCHLKMGPSGQPAEVNTGVTLITLHMYNAGIPIPDNRTVGFRDGLVIPPWSYTWWYCEGWNEDAPNTVEINVSFTNRIR